MKFINATLTCGLCSVFVEASHEILDREIQASVDVVAEYRKLLTLEVVKSWLEEHRHGVNKQIAALSVTVANVEVCPAKTEQAPGFTVECELPAGHRGSHRKKGGGYRWEEDFGFTDEIPVGTG